jgi:acetyl esterase/lipase
MKRCLCSLAIVAFFSSSVMAQEPKSTPKPPKLPDGVVLEADIVYGKAGERELHLDLVRPEKEPTKPLPVIAFIHGGGWRNGNKRGGVGNVAALVATGNYIGVSIEYRLTGEAIWPAQINDCKAAIRWLRANAATYHIDPDRIAVWGGSAGGHLVSLLGTSGDVADLEGNNGNSGYSSRVNAVVDYCGPSDLLAFIDSEVMQKPDSPLALLFGGPVQEHKAEAKQASPVTYVTSDDPSFLVVHGTVDPLVPLAQAETLTTALKKAGVPVTFIRMEGGGHSIRGPEITARVHAFLDKTLRAQDVEVSAEPVVVAAE